MSGWNRLGVPIPLCWNVCRVKCHWNSTENTGRWGCPYFLSKDGIPWNHHCWACVAFAFFLGCVSALTVSSICIFPATYLPLPQVWVWKPYDKAHQSKDRPHSPSSMSREQTHCPLQPKVVEVAGVFDLDVNRGRGRSPAGGSPGLALAWPWALCHHRSVSSSLWVFLTWTMKTLN